MTTTTAPTTVTPTARVTGIHLLRSEWIKLWSLRSTYWTLPITAVVFLGVVTLLSFALRGQDAADAAQFGIGYVPFQAAVQTAMTPLLVLGALNVAGEYSTGQIRSSILAAPRRLSVLWSKGAVLIGVTLVVTAVLVGAAVAINAAVTNGTQIALDFGEAEAQRIVVGNVLYLTTITAFAFALGGLLRHPAAAMATVLGLLLVVENIVSGVSMVWRPMQAIAPFLPGQAGSRVIQPDSQIASLNEANTYGIHLGPWEGYAVLVGWVILALTFAALRLRTRDA